MVRLKKKGNLICVVARIVLAATVYFIWYERNRRVFDQCSISEDHLVKEICDSVRSRLVFLSRDRNGSGIEGLTGYFAD